MFSTPIPPLPPTGGGTRSYELLKVAARMGDVDLVCFQPLNEEQRQQLAAFSKRIIAPLPEPAQKQAGKQWKLKYFGKLFLPFLFSASELNHELGFFVRHRLKSVPILRAIYFQWLLLFFKQRELLPAADYQVNGMFQPAAPAIHALQEEIYDLVFCDFTYFTPHFLRKGLIRYRHVVLNAHNAEYELVEQSGMTATDGVEKKWIQLQSGLMKEQEKRNLQLASLTFCCSEADQIKLQGLAPDAKLAVIPNGVDTDFFQPGIPTSNSSSLLFTGTMNYYPNREAVKWFLQAVFPTLREKYPDLRFMIAGSNAAGLDIQDNKNIVLIDSPADMRPFFDAATLVVVPLLHGSGTRLKILEAAAMQKPIVSTSLGAEGLTGLSNDILLLADTAREMMHAIDRLISDTQLQMLLKKNARQWVLANYSWKQIGEKAIAELKLLQQVPAEQLAV